MNSQNNDIENIQNSVARNNGDQNKEIDEEEEEMKKGCNWAGWIIRITIVLVLLSLAIWIILDSSRLTGIFKDFINWMKNNPFLAPFALIFVYIFATIFFLPGLILTLGAGFAFNEAYGNVGSMFKFKIINIVAILVGATVVWIGAMIGSILAMLIGRYLLRNWVGKKARKYKVFGAIDTAIEKEVSQYIILFKTS